MKISTRNILVWFLTFSFCVQLLNAQGIKITNMNELIPPDKDIRIGKLANGLTYYIKYNKKPEYRAELRLAVKAGAVLEDDDQDGLAHFVEHMAFNGSKNFPKNDLVNYLESIGSKFGPDINAYTSHDRTVYMLQIPTDDKSIFNNGLQVLRDWAADLTFDPQEIDKERGVILEEWRLGKGAEDRVQKKHQQILFYNSRFAERDVIGDTNIILHAPYANFTRFYHDWYRPNLMAVIAVGDFDIDYMEKQIIAKFSDLKNPPNERKLTKYDLTYHKETLASIETDKELSMTTIQIMSKMPGRQRGNYSEYRSNIIDNLFSDMLNNRMQEKSRKSDAPFIIAQSGIFNFMGNSRVFFMFSIPKGDNVLQAKEATLAEVQRVRQHGFTQSELDRAKTNTLRSYEKSLSEKDKTESAMFANEFIRAFLDDESIPGIETETELVKYWLPGITLDEVNTLAEQLIKPDNNVIMISAPEKEGSTVPTKEEVLLTFNSVWNKIYEPYVDEVASGPLMSKTLKPGTIVNEKRINEIDLTEWTLSNGVKVVFKPTDFKNDEIQMQAWSPGGHSIFDDNSFINASNAGSVINESGIGEINADKLTKLLAGKIVSVSPYISELYEGFRGYASPQDLETMFQLIYLYFNEARVDEEAIAAMKNRLKVLIENKDNSPESVFQDTIQYVSSGYHFRSKPFEELMIEKINGDKIFDLYYNRFEDASDFTFFFVGNINIDELKKFATTYLANLPSKNRKENWKDINKNYPKGKVERTVYKGIEEKSFVRLIISGDFEWNEKNNFELRAMTSILSIKLRETLREDKGGVYGVGAFAAPSKYPKERYQLHIMFGCNPARVDELINAVYDEISDMINNLPTDSNMVKVKEINRRELETNLKDNRFWINRISSAYINSGDPRAILKQQEMIDKLTAKDIQAAAKKYLKTDNLMKFVLYPEKK